MAYCWNQSKFFLITLVCEWNYLLHPTHYQRKLIYLSLCMDKKIYVTWYQSPNSWFVNMVKSTFQMCYQLIQVWYKDQTLRILFWGDSLLVYTIFTFWFNNCSTKKLWNLHSAFSLTGWTYSILNWIAWKALPIFIELLCRIFAKVEAKVKIYLAQCSTNIKDEPLISCWFQ